MRRNLRHDISFFQSLDNHLLLNGRDVFFQIKIFENSSSDSSESILTLAQADIKPPVNQCGDQGAPHQSETFIKRPVQFTGATDQPRAADMVRLTLQDRLKKLGNVLWIMGAIGIEKDYDVPFNMWDGGPYCHSFPFTFVNEDMRSGSPSNVWSAVIRPSIDDNYLVGKGFAPFDDLPDGLLLI